MQQETKSKRPYKLSFSKKIKAQGYTFISTIVLNNAAIQLEGATEQTIYHSLTVTYLGQVVHQAHITTEQIEPATIEVIARCNAHAASMAEMPEPEKALNILKSLRYE